MPNSRTFSIKPISEMIHRYLNGGVVVDPFANDSKLGTITNDIDPSCNTTFHLEATEFLKQLDSEYADVVLYDPPYSPRQVSDCSILKISKEHFESLEEFNQSVVDYFQETLGYKINKIRKPDGWIQW